MRFENNGDELIDKLGIRGELAKDYNLMPREDIYSEYDMKVPESVMKFCEFVAKTGGRALVVGGCTREMVSAKLKDNKVFNAKDIDMEVYGIKPNDLVAIVEVFFSSDKKKTNGKSFEVISVMDRVDNIGIDISIPRESSLSGVDRNGFCFDSRPDFTILQASFRRDLTCNSISYDPLTKIVYDPYQGVRDVKDNILKIISIEKFSEDPVRIFRLIQLLARSEGEVDQESEDYCKKLFSKIKNQSQEVSKKPSAEIAQLNPDRVYKEFVKLFTKGVKPSLGLEFARRIGVIDYYFPVLAKTKGVQQEYAWHKEGDVWNHIMQAVDAAAEIAIRDGLNEADRLVLLLSALCHDLGKVTTTKIEQVTLEGNLREVITSRGHEADSELFADQIFDRIMGIGVEGLNELDVESNLLSVAPHSRELKGKVKSLVKNHMHLRTYYGYYKDGVKTDRMMGRLARDLDKSGTNIFLLLKLAESDQRARKEKSLEPFSLDEVGGLNEMKSWVESCEYTRLPDKLVEGKKIIEILGLKPGVLVGVLAEWVYDDQLAGVVDSIDVGLDKAKIYYEVVLSGLNYIKESGLYVRKDTKKIMPKDLDDEILVWMKNGDVKDMLIKRFL